jgi:hypothetical protein
VEAATSMMGIVLGVIGVVAGAFVGYLLVRARRGLSAARHLCRFEAVYDALCAQVGSRETALDRAFAEFRTCPGLRELTSAEAKQVIELLALAPDPKWVVRSIVLRMDSGNMLRAFRDRQFLNEVVDVAVRRG